MRCPVDGTTLGLAERAGVEIDYCPECRGVWLDRGELDRIIERSGAGRRRDEQPGGYRRDEHDYEHHHDEDRYARPAKKRGGAFSALTGLLGGDED